MADPRADAEGYLRACAAVGVVASREARIARGLLAALVEIERLTAALTAANDRAEGLRLCMEAWRAKAERLEAEHEPDGEG